MSDEKKPMINVTRGRKRDAEQRSGSKRESLSVPGPMDVASGVVRGVRNAWLAGLGAVSIAEETGRQLFQALVQEGKSWERARREQTNATAKQIERLSKEGVQAVEAVEERVWAGVDGVLRRLDVPRRDDLEELHRKVDKLSRKVDRLANTVSEKPASSGKDNVHSERESSVE